MVASISANLFALAPAAAGLHGNGDTKGAAVDHAPRGAQPGRNGAGLRRVDRGVLGRRGTVGIRKDGRPVDLSITVSPIRDLDGRIVGASLIARAITHRKEAEAAIRERDTLRYVASLAAAAAHEINNPLTAVSIQAELLAGEVDAKGRGRIDEILTAVSRIQETVTRMERVTQSSWLRRLCIYQLCST